MLFRSRRLGRIGDRHRPRRAWRGRQRRLCRRPVYRIRGAAGVGCGSGGGTCSQAISTIRPLPSAAKTASAMSVRTVGGMGRNPRHSALTASSIAEIGISCETIFPRRPAPKSHNQFVHLLDQQTVPPQHVLHRRCHDTGRSTAVPVSITRFCRTPRLLSNKST